MTGRHRWRLLIIEVPAVVVTVVMMGHVVANAVLRTVANHPVPHTLEIVQYWYMPLVAFLGFIAAQMRGQHIEADLLYERLPRAAKRGVLAVVLVIAALTCAAFAWFGLLEALDALDTRRTAGVSPVPAWPAYFLVPVAFTGLTVQFGLGAWRAATRGVTEHGAQHDGGDEDAADFLEREVSRG